ncbi:hypothetical protein GJ496_002191 [Pomphorhynchus laevis]|nr:hypothetical protein GJ496_002191 [Pomphorhynchus laevis]
MSQSTLSEGIFVSPSKSPVPSRKHFFDQDDDNYHELHWKLDQAPMRPNRRPNENPRRLVRTLSPMICEALVNELSKRHNLKQ